MIVSECYSIHLVSLSKYVQCFVSFEHVFGELNHFCCRYIMCKSVLFYNLIGHSNEIVWLLFSMGLDQEYFINIVKPNQWSLESN